MEGLTPFWVEYVLDLDDVRPDAVAAAVGGSCDALVRDGRLALGVFATDPAAAAVTANEVLGIALAETGAAGVDAATLAPAVVRPRESWPGAQRVDALPAGTEPATIEAPDGRVLRFAHEGGLGRWAMEVDGDVWEGRELRLVVVGALGLDYEDPFVHEVLRTLQAERVSGAWRFRCPCCEQATLGEPPPGTYDICGACGWEDDGLQFADPSFRGGANVESLAEARARRGPRAT